MRAVVLITAFTLAPACSASPIAPSPVPSIPLAPPSDASDAPVDATQDSAAEARSSEAEPDAALSGCPSDMKLVDGDFCTRVEQKCRRKWNSKYTHKTVCMEFEAPSRCVGDKQHKRFCIDTYEWPNVAGQRPEVMSNFYQAQVKCASVGKRLCTETEWTQACEGPEMKPFPNGYVRDPLKCNGDHLWDDPSLKKVEAYDPDELARLWKGVRSGSQPGCISDYGVADMPANVDEVSFNEEILPFSRDKYDNAITGGNWYQGVRNQCRPKVYTHDDGWSYYFLGLRCCAEPDGKPSDPRAPRQIAHGWDFKRVESLARFTTEQMREKLLLKREGKCTCAVRDTLCRIMCGDMLGPRAHDADPNRIIPKPGRD
ncbi:MAG: SUMF1/EgtB/PvdO family nonheme iron enzyme [Deltaproteobacteria bacterium]|nr:SUMF1/EgtB/PvdO family nonheme iron enzyme [Deltaproteobacteria bacterium]